MECHKAFEHCLIVNKLPCKYTHKDFESWALEFPGGLIDESRYPRNSVHCESTFKKMMCFQELGLPRLPGEPPSHRFFQVRFLRSIFKGYYTCLVSSPPFPPDFSFTTEKPHARGGISHWLDNRPHSAAVYRWMTAI